MGIPIYSDVDVKGGINVGGSVNILGATTIDNNVYITGETQIDGVLEASDNVILRGDTTLINDIIITQDTITISQQQLKITSNEGEDSIEYSGSIWCDKPETIYNTTILCPEFKEILSCEVTKKNGTIPGPIVSCVPSNNEVVVKAHYKWSEDVNIWPAGGSTVSFTIRVTGIIPIPSILATRIDTNVLYASEDHSKGTVDERLNDLDARLSELGFSGGYVLGGEIYIDELSANKRGVLGYIARCGKIEYGYIYDGSDLENYNEEYGINLYSICGVKNIQIFKTVQDAIDGNNPIDNVFLGPQDSNRVVTWSAYIQTEATYRKIAYETIVFNRINNVLQITTTDINISNSVLSFTSDPTRWVYFCWSTDGNYEPHNSKS